MSLEHKAVVVAGANELACGLSPDGNKSVEMFRVCDAEERFVTCAVIGGLSFFGFLNAILEQILE